MFRNFDLFFPYYKESGRKMSESKKRYISKRNAQRDCDEYFNKTRRIMANEYYKLTGEEM
jgi:hypothetical protein